MEKKEIDVNCEDQDFSETRKMSKPIMYSTLRHRNQMEELQKVKNVNLPQNEALMLSKPKLTKLNFGVHKKVFGDLTPINVNDTLLLPKEKLSIPKKYIQSSNRVPTPDLHDFVDSLPSSSVYVVEEPQINLEFLEYNFDVMLNYKSIKNGL